MSTKSIKKNAVYNGVKTVAAIVFPLITFPYISRVLQVENVGKINFGLSIVSYFSLIASLGINAYAIRECAMIRDDKNKLEKLASQIFSINILTTIIAYFLLGIFLFLYTKIYAYRKLIILQSLSIIFTTIGTDWVNSALEDFKYITIRTVTMQIVSIILMFLLVKVPEDYMKYVVISLVASSGANIVNVFYIRKFCKISFTFNFEFNKHIKSIIFMFVMILAQTIFNNVDMSMLGIMSGDKAVGIYSTGHKIILVIEQLVTSILWVIMPRMSLYFANKDYDSINQLFTNVFNFTLTIGLPMIIGILFLSKDIIIAFAGISYVESYKVLMILSMSTLCTFFGGSLLGNILLLPAKKEIYMMKCCISIAVFNIISNYILIPLYGANGAALTTLTCSIISGILAFLKIDKKIKIIDAFSIIYKPIIGTFAISVICLYCKNFSNVYLRIIFSILLSTILYFSIELLLGNLLVMQSIKAFIKKVRHYIK